MRKPTSLSLLRSLRLERLEDRSMFHGEEISFLGFGSLTYSYAPDGTAVGRGDNSLFETFDRVAARAQWQEATAKAIQTWSVYANINIGLVRDSGAA